MNSQTQSSLPVKTDTYNQPVESIMKCDDFKSNFARKLSNRYTSRSPVPISQQDNLRLFVKTENLNDTTQESIEPHLQLSRSSDKVENSTVTPRYVSKNADRHIEIRALNTEVETLKWQLVQTEANRQMQIALLTQIVSCLNRVRDHIEGQTDYPERRSISDLPRSQSVMHVNRSYEYSQGATKKTYNKKFIKSTNDVNKDGIGVWTQSKLSLTAETAPSQKIIEELSRLITLANTVLSTKIPDLAGIMDIVPINDLSITDYKKEHTKSFPASLKRIEEETLDVFSNPIYNKHESANIFVKTDKETTKNVCLEQKPSDITESIAKVKESISDVEVKTCNNPKYKKLDFNHVSNFIEDESGFSSMSSFQEIGIPIISIIPPSPIEQVEFDDNMFNVIDKNGKWEPDNLKLDKPTVKVFWV